MCNPCGEVAQAELRAVADRLKGLRFTVPNGPQRPPQVVTGSVRVSGVGMSVAQVACAVGVTEEAVRSLLREGRLEGSRLMRGRRLVWDVDEQAVLAWTSRRRIAVVEPLAISDPLTQPQGAQVAMADPNVGALGELAELRRENAKLRQALAVFVS